MASYGANCSRCGVYFVTSEREDRTCPWCRRVEAGSMQVEMLEVPEAELQVTSQAVQLSP